MQPRSDLLYEFELPCPLCEHRFTTLRVAKSRLVPIERQRDFYVKYSGDVNPYYYDVTVCPQCGYASGEATWRPPMLDLERICEGLAGRLPKDNYCGVRDFDLAVKSYMLAIHSLSFRRHPKGATGLMYMRLGWLYRGVDEAQEQRFLGLAAQYLEQALATEDEPPGNLTPLTTMYLIGEYYIRTGQVDKGLLFLGQVVQDPALKQERNLERVVREAWSEARAKHKESE